MSARQMRKLREQLGQAEGAAAEPIAEGDEASEGGDNDDESSEEEAGGKAPFNPFALLDDEVGR